MWSLHLDLFVSLLIATVSTSYGQNPQELVGFTVMCTADVVAFEKTKVEYDLVVTNIDNEFNTVNSSFTTPTAGTYYASISGGIYPGRDLSLRLEDEETGEQYISVMNTNRNINGTEIASRGLFAHVKANKRLVVTAQVVSGASSPPTMPLISWTMFRYEDLTNTVVATSVAINRTQDGRVDPLPFNVEILNVGLFGVKPFNMTTSMFTAPLTAIYFFHLTAGAMPQRELRLHLISSQNPSVPFASLTHNAIATSGIDQLSRSAMMVLEAGTQVKVLNDFGSATFSDDGYETSLSIFGYALDFEDSTSAVCFFAGRNHSWSDIITLAPVAPWDAMYVNQGSGFDMQSGLFTCPLAGAYFVSFSAGALAEDEVRLRLHKNGELVTTLVRDATRYVGHDTLSRDVIVELAAGDVLHLEGQAATSLYSDPGLQTSFMAFRLRLVGPIGPGKDSSTQ